MIRRGKSRANPTTNASEDNDLRSELLDELFPHSSASQLGCRERPSEAVVGSSTPHACDDSEMIVTQNMDIDEGPSATLARWLADDTTQPTGPDPTSPVERWTAPREEGSVAGTARTCQSTYLEDLEQQMRDNKARKRREAEQERRLDAKIAQERELLVRYGGGGEPLRGADGEIVRSTRGALVYDSPGSATGVEGGRTPVAGRSPRSAPPPKGGVSPSRQRPPLPLPTLPEKTEPLASDAEESLRRENEALKREVRRLTSQMDLLLEAFQLERQKNQGPAGYDGGPKY